LGFTFESLKELEVHHMDYFKLNLHASIADRLWFSLKAHPKYILIISK